MGLKIPPIPDDYDFVLDCLCCYDAGKTPNYVFIRFWDITACGAKPSPPNGMTFIAAQHPTIGCHFQGEIEFGGLTWRAEVDLCHWHAGENRSQIVLTAPGSGLQPYFVETGDPCQVDFGDNDMTCPDGGGEGGHAHIQVFIPIIIIILSTGASSLPVSGDPGYGFLPLDGLLYEERNVGMDHKLIHLAHRNGKTNVLIYVDDEDIPYP